MCINRGKITGFNHNKSINKIKARVWKTELIFLINLDIFANSLERIVAILQITCCNFFNEDAVTALLKNA